MSRRLPKTISIRCHNCSQTYTLIFSPNRRTFDLRIRYAICPHCEVERVPSIVEPGYFRCKMGCNVIYKITPTWKPVKGGCMNCIMREWRAKRRSPTVTPGSG